jgi:hypothetical protein
MISFWEPTARWTLHTTTLFIDELSRSWFIKINVNRSLSRWLSVAGPYGYETTKNTHLWCGRVNCSVWNRTHIVLNYARVFFSPLIRCPSRYRNNEYYWLLLSLTLWLTGIPTDVVRTDEPYRFTLPRVTNARAGQWRAQEFCMRGGCHK